MLEVGIHIRRMHDTGSMLLDAAIDSSAACNLPLTSLCNPFRTKMQVKSCFAVGSVITDS